MKKIQISLYFCFLRIYSYICLDFAAHVLQNVKITPERVKVLVGDTLILNCTGKTTHNGRIKFTWDFPKSKVSSGFTFDTFLLYVKGTLAGCSSNVYDTFFIFRKIDMTHNSPWTCLPRCM